MRTPLCLLRLWNAENKWLPYQTANACRGIPATAAVFVREPTEEEHEVVEVCLSPDCTDEVYHLVDLVGTTIRFKGKERP